VTEKRSVIRTWSPRAASIESDADVDNIVDMTRQPILHGVGLTKRYGDQLAVDSLSFSVEPP
jgi:hypothetical protein